MIDVGQVLGMTSRILTRRESDGAYVLTATRSYDTSASDLWDAITSAERIPRWFLPISGDLRLGGRYQLKGNAGGEVVRCVPPRELGLTWEMHGEVSWVNVALTESDPDNTTLRLEHIAPVPDDLWKTFGPGAVGVGWDSALLGLDQLFATNGSVNPDTALAWLASDEGKRFLHESSDAWRLASIAFGTDPEQAAQAARRTTAAYMGESFDDTTG
jgi:uncharacterized protein YndB with AHSA1/START domain